LTPLDPSRQWLAAGITGLSREREWDAVVTVAAAGRAGEEVELVVLPSGDAVVEAGPPDVDVTPLVAALAGSLGPPYRAVAVRREDVWAVGARAIEAVELSPEPDGVDLELSWDGSSLQLVVDGLPKEPGAAAALERLARERVPGPYAAHAHRLAEGFWEVLVLAL
jgi:hypothetical protein